MAAPAAPARVAARRRLAVSCSNGGDELDRPAVKLAWYAAAHPSGSFCLELLGISDPFCSGLLPAHPAGGSSSGSFRPVAAHGNNPTRPPFCPHSNA
eukprot:COSAG01_NODE_45218_length_411_cov_1.083333_1_plen_96_part_10